MKVWKKSGICLVTLLINYAPRSILVLSNDKIMVSFNTGLITLWSLREKKIIKRFEGHSGCSKLHKFSNGLVFSYSHDKTIRTWDLVSAESKILLSSNYSINTFILLNFTQSS